MLKHIFFSLILIASLAGNSLYTMEDVLPENNEIEDMLEETDNEEVQNARAEDAAHRNKEGKEEESDGEQEGSYEDLGRLMEEDECSTREASLREAPPFIHEVTKRMS